MSAAPCGRLRGAPGVFGWLLAVRLWNYGWWDLLGESRLY